MVRLWSGALSDKRLMKFPNIFIVAILFAAGPGIAQAVDAPVLSLGQALRAAAENFDVAIARAAVDGAHSDLLAADHAPLPLLSVKAGSIDLQHGIGPGSLLADKRIDKSVGLDWTWERGDKRVLRNAAARSGMKAAQSDFLEMRIEQQLQAQAAFYDLLAAQQSEREIKAIAESAQAMAGVLRQRLRAGDVSAQDLARVEIEAIKASIDQETSSLTLQRAAMALAQILGLRSQPRVEEVWPALHVAVALAESEQAAAVEARPDVQAAQARVDQALAGLDVALASRKADLTWGLSVDHYPGTSTRQIELRLQMPLQVGYGQEGEIGRARAQVQQAQDLAAKTRLSALIEQSRLWQEARIAAIKASSQEFELLPRARQLLTQAELAYGKGAQTLTELLDARRSLRASLLDAIACQADFAKAQGSWVLRSHPQSAP